MYGKPSATTLLSNSLKCIRCNLSLHSSSIRIWKATMMMVSSMCCFPSSRRSQLPSQQTMAGGWTLNLLVKDQPSWSLSCISFPPKDKSNKARTVQSSSYLHCNGPPPLYSSLLAPVHTGCRTGLPQEWAAQLSRSLTSLTYLSFICHRPRGLFSTNIGRNSIHYTLCEMVRLITISTFCYTSSTPMTSLCMHQS